MIVAQQIHTGKFAESSQKRPLPTNCGKTGTIFGPPLCVESRILEWIVAFDNRFPHEMHAFCLASTGFATKTVSQGAPLPTEHSKITILHGIGCSLNLSISYCCSFVFWEYLCGLLSMGKQSIGKLCHMSGHPLLQKARTVGLGPPAPPSNKHNRFQYTVPSHTKSCMAHSGGRRVRGKKPGFL